MLSLVGAQVRVAESAAEAFLAMDDFQPELLVCDIAMPEEDGYQLIQRIRQRPGDRGGAVPALALSALASEQDRAFALSAGFQLHMGKPIDIDRLTSALSRLLEQARSDSAAPQPS